MLPLLLSPAFAFDWLVAQDGSGDFTTITEAFLYAGQGDTVRVWPGTYDAASGEPFPLLPPTGVTLAGDGAGRTILDVGEERVGAVYIDGDRVTVEGVTIRNAATALYVAAAEFVLTDSTIEGCEAGLHTAFESAEGPTVRRVSFVDVSSDAIDDYGSNGEFTDLVIRQLVGSLWGMNVNGVVDGVDSNAIVAVGTGHNIVVADSVSDPPDACIGGDAIYFSTVVGCTAEFAIDASVVQSSIAAHNEGVGIHASQVAAYNLTWDNTGGDLDLGSAGASVANLDADPQFRAYGDGDADLRLAAGSPAIDAGGGDSPATDVDGVSRPQDGDGDGRARSDIGAYEWGEVDLDGDGWFADGGDCDDGDPEVNPGAFDEPYDGIDQDCDGEDQADVDGDGHRADHQGGDDCDDTNPAVHAGAWDIPENGVDEDCDGADAEHTCLTDPTLCDSAEGDDTDSGTGGDGGDECGCGAPAPMTGLAVAAAALAVRWRRPHGAGRR